MRKKEQGNASLEEKQHRLLEELRRIHGSDEKAQKAFLYGGLAQVWGLTPRQSNKK